MAREALKKYTSNSKYARSINAARLQILVDLMEEDGEASLQEVIEQAFEDAADPLNALSQTSKSIQKKAAAANFHLRIVKDSFKNKPLSERKVWLEGDDLRKKKVLDEQTKSTQQPESNIENLARPQKPTIPVLVCYAKKEAEQAAKLDGIPKRTIKRKQTLSLCI